MDGGDTSNGLNVFFASSHPHRTDLFLLGARFAYLSTNDAGFFYIFIVKTDKCVHSSHMHVGAVDFFDYHNNIIIRVGLFHFFFYNICAIEHE